MREGVKREICKLLSAVSEAIGSKTDELDDISKENENPSNGFIDTAEVGDEFPIDEELQARYNVLRFTVSKADSWAASVQESMTGVSFDAEREYLRNVGIETQNLIDEINAI